MFSQVDEVCEGIFHVAGAVDGNGFCSLERTYCENCLARKYFLAFHILIVMLREKIALK